MSRTQTTSQTATVPASFGRIRSLVTPEGVDLRLRVADFGERAGALMIDLVIMIVALAAVSIAMMFIFSSLRGSDVMVEIMTVIWVLAFFFLRSF